MLAWMFEHRSGAGVIAIAVLTLAPTGCAAAGGWDARPAWSTPAPPLSESMLPPHETWTMDETPRRGLAEFFHYLSEGWKRSDHVACGPDDDACAARLRSAPVHAADWRNRFPTL